jgi:hypothetical protein
MQNLGRNGALDRIGLAFGKTGVVNLHFCRDFLS